jgi:hypothetical protein
LATSSFVEMCARWVFAVSAERKSRLPICWFVQPSATRSATRQCHDAVVREHVAVDRVERRIAEVRADSAAQPRGEAAHAGVLRRETELVESVDTPLVGFAPASKSLDT